MTFNGVQGQDLLIESTTHVIIRIQGLQWRIQKPSTGVAVFEGKWTRRLNYYGNKPVKGEVWIGKESHDISISPRG